MPEDTDPAARQADEAAGGAQDHDGVEPEVRAVLQDHVAYLAGFVSPGFVPKIGQWVVDVESGLVGRVIETRRGIIPMSAPLCRMVCSDNGRNDADAVAMWRSTKSVMPTHPGMAFQVASATFVPRKGITAGHAAIDVKPFLVVARDTLSAIPPASLHAAMAIGAEVIGLVMTEMHVEAVPEPFGRVVRLAA